MENIYIACLLYLDGSIALMCDHGFTTLKEEDAMFYDNKDEAVRWLSDSMAKRKMNKSGQNFYSPAVMEINGDTFIVDFVHTFNPEEMIDALKRHREKFK